MKLRNAILAIAAFSLFACNQSATETTEKAENPSKAEVIEANNTAKATTEDAVTNAEAVEEKAYAAFEFEETTFDFGEINQGDVVNHTFTFTNVGEAPLIITNTRVTCGCTTPSYTKEPVAPGETGKIEVQFNSTGKSGKQNKVITIYANTESQRERISITTMVNVEKKIDGPYKVQ